MKIKKVIKKLDTTIYLCYNNRVGITHSHNIHKEK